MGIWGLPIGSGITRFPGLVLIVEHNVNGSVSLGTSVVVIKQVYCMFQYIIRWVKYSGSSCSGISLFGLSTEVEHVHVYPYLGQVQRYRYIFCWVEVEHIQSPLQR